MVKRGTPSKGGEEGEERQRGCPVPSSPGFQAFAGWIWSGTRDTTRDTDCVCMSQRACRKGSAVESWMTSVCGV